MTGKWQEGAVERLATSTEAIAQTVTPKGWTRLVFKDNRNTGKLKVGRANDMRC